MFQQTHPSPPNSASPIGNGGTGPLGSMSRLGTSGMFCTVSFSLLAPVSSVVRPTLPFNPKRWCTLGRRRSASISRTRASPWARMHARLLAVVVLPSDGVALVNRMNFGGCPARRKQQRGPQRSEGLGKLRLRLRQHTDVALCRRTCSPSLPPTSVAPAERRPATAVP